MSKKRPGRRPNPDSKRQQGEDRHTTPRLAFHLPQPLLDALDGYIADTKPRPSYTAVLLTALEEFLVKKGRWPLAEAGES